MEYIEIEQAVVNCLNKMLTPDLGQHFLCINISDQVELLQNCGIDFNDPALAEEAARVNGGNIPGGQCLAGPCGQVVLNSFAKNLPSLWRKQMGEKGIAHYLSKVAGYVLIFSSNIATVLYQWQEAAGKEPSANRIWRVVLSNVAHELRHSFQPAEMVKLEVLGFADLKAYDAQPHEQDANIFAYGCIRGWCNLTDAATWQPTAEQREEALHFWETV